MIGILLSGVFTELCQSQAVILGLVSVLSVLANFRGSHSPEYHGTFSVFLCKQYKSLTEDKDG